MIGRRTEHHHNTAEQIRGYLAAALEVVAELEVPDDLRIAAFTKAVDLAASKSVTVEQVAPIGNSLGLMPGH